MNIKHHFDTVKVILITFSTGKNKCDSDKCDMGYVVDADTKTCKACSANCKKCKSNGAGQCDTNECEDGFALSDTSKTCIGKYL